MLYICVCGPVCICMSIFSVSYKTELDSPKLKCSKKCVCLYFWATISDEDNPAEYTEITEFAYSLDLHSDVVNILVCSNTNMARLLRLQVVLLQSHRNKQLGRILTGWHHLECFLKMYY